MLHDDGLKPERQGLGENLAFSGPAQKFHAFASRNFRTMRRSAHCALCPRDLDGQAIVLAITFVIQLFGQCADHMQSETTLL